MYMYGCHIDKSSHSSDDVQCHTDSTVMALMMYRYTGVKLISLVIALMMRSVILIVF